MGGEEGGESRTTLADRFGSEAVKAGREACRTILELASKPRGRELVEYALETIHDLLESHAAYTVSLVELMAQAGDSGAAARAIQNIPATVASVLAAAYGPELGFALAVLTLIPAMPLVDVIGSCGGEGLRDPESLLEARLRTTLLQAQMTVYRLYFELAGETPEALEDEGEGEGAPVEGRLWKPDSIYM